MRADRGDRRRRAGAPAGARARRAEAKRRRCRASARRAAVRSRWLRPRRRRRASSAIAERRVRSEVERQDQLGLERRREASISASMHARVSRAACPSSLRDAAVEVAVVAVDGRLVEDAGRRLDSQLGQRSTTRQCARPPRTSRAGTRARPAQWKQTCRCAGAHAPSAAWRRSVRRRHGSRLPARRGRLAACWMSGFFCDSIARSESSSTPRQPWCFRAALDGELGGSS